MIIGSYLGSTLIGAVSVNLSANRYDWLQAELFGVDVLVFYSDGAKRWWLMDEFTYSR